MLKILSPPLLERTPRSPAPIVAPTIPTGPPTIADTPSKPLKPTAEADFDDPELSLICPSPVNC